MAVLHGDKNAEQLIGRSYLYVALLTAQILGFFKRVTTELNFRNVYHFRLF